MARTIICARGVACNMRFRTSLMNGMLMHSNVCPAVGVLRVLHYVDVVFYPIVPDFRLF
jgi:hypothetical protein